MRILLVNYRYFVSGGPERYMFNVKKLLEDNGNEVIPFSVLSSRNVDSEYSKYFVEPIGSRDSVYYNEVRKTPKAIWKMITRSIYSIEVQNAIKKEIIDTKPDVVYIIHFVNKLSPSVIIGAKQMGVPVVLRLSDYFVLCPRFDFLYQRNICEDCLKYGYKSCIRKKCVQNSRIASVIRVISMKVHMFLRIYNKVDAFVTPSAFLKDKMIDSGFDAERIFHIPTFSTDVQGDKEPHLGTYALYFGRITEEKGVETIVKAYEKMPDKELKIVGDDTTEEGVRLKRYVKEKNLYNIEFVGFKQGIELEQAIRKSRFTIIPSIWYDNFPNTALESFSMYKPVIASDIGSLPELVVDGVSGYLFKSGDEEDLREKIRQLDDDGTVEELGRNGYEMVINAFSAQRHYEDLIGVFRKVKCN